RGERALIILRHGFLLVSLLFRRYCIILGSPASGEKLPYRRLRLVGIGSLQPGTSGHALGQGRHASKRPPSCAWVVHDHAQAKRAYHPDQLAAVAAGEEFVHANLFGVFVALLERLQVGERGQWFLLLVPRALWIGADRFGHALREWGEHPHQFVE